MENLSYIVFLILSMVVIQIGLTIRRIKIENSKKERLEIIEKNKLKRIEKLAELDIAKINAIGDYENKDSSLCSE